MKGQPTHLCARRISRNVRGRFEIVIPFTAEEGGGSLRITSAKDRNMTAEEIGRELRGLLDQFVPIQPRGDKS